MATTVTISTTTKIVSISTKTKIGVAAFDAPMTDIHLNPLGRPSVVDNPGLRLSSKTATVVDVDSSTMGYADAVDGSATKSASQASTLKDPSTKVVDNPCLRVSYPVVEEATSTTVEMGYADAVDGAATKSASQVSTFKDPSTKVPTKPLMKPFVELPDRNTVEDPGTFIQFAKVIASVNAIQIFHQWDYTNEGFLSLKEFQAGLLAADILVESPLIHAAMRRVCLRQKHEDKVAVQEFVAFFLTLCGEDPLEMQTYLQKLSKVVPDGLYGITTYLDSHSPQVAQYHKQHGPEVESDSAQTNTNPKGSQVTLDEMDTLSVEGWNKSALSLLSPKGIFQVLTFQKGPLPALLFFIIWELGFATFYCFYDEFRFDRAYYYAAQAGLSVGFGTLTEECLGGLPCEDHRPAHEYDISKMVTILNVLLGSSVIGGALGYFVEIALKDHGDWYEAMIKAHDEGERVEELQKEGKEILLGLEYLKVFYENNLMEVRLCLIVLAMIFLGLLYGMIWEKWSFVTSLYYCITGLSTAGLQIPDPDVFGMIFTGTYVLLGVPLYGGCLGIFANCLIRKNQAKTEEEHFNKVITANESMYFSKLLAKKDDMEAEVAIDDLNEIEFLELELLRNGKVDAEFVNEARRKFREYDSNLNGFVTWTQIVAINLFRQYRADSDEDGPDLLNLSEFKACVDDLSKAPHSLTKFPTDGIEGVFQACVDSHVHDGVTTTHFYHFAAAVMGGMTDLRNWKGPMAHAPPKRNVSSMRHAGIDAASSDTELIELNNIPASSSRPPPSHEQLTPIRITQKRVLTKQPH